jgi:transmembrane sensor
VSSPNNDNIRILITRYLSGEASSFEEKQLFDWVSQSSENEQEFLKFKKSWQLSGQKFEVAAKDLAIDVDHEWNVFLEKSGNKTSRVVPLGPPSKNLLWLRYAAVILVLILCGWAVQYFITDASTTVIRTANASRKVTLPDGSQITLNQRSMLTYSQNFGKDDRKLTLEGEGFFDVVADQSKPFIINCGEVTVQVVGTSFNVRAYDSIAEAEVIVRSGIVKVSTHRVKEGMQLQAGQKVTYLKTDYKLIQSTNNDQNYLAWNTREIVFSNATLQEVAQTLERTYGVKIMLPDTVPSSCEVSASFNDQTLESVMKVLERTLNLNYRRVGNNIEITDTGC